MDKLVAELIQLLESLVAAYTRLLVIAEKRREAMGAFDTHMLNKLLEREHDEVLRCQSLEQVRQTLVEKFKHELGRNIQPTTSEIARRCPEPLKSRILVLSGQIRETMEKLERNNRINHRAAQAVVGAIARVMKVVTGLAQHAGLYLRNGRKAAIRGIHMLDIAG